MYDLISQKTIKLSLMMIKINTIMMMMKIMKLNLTIIMQMDKVFNANTA